MSESVFAALDDFCKKYGYSGRSKGMRALGFKNTEQLSGVNIRSFKKKISEYDFIVVQRRKTKERVDYVESDIKKRTCLKCGNLFLSMSKSNRLCPKDRGASEAANQ